MPAGNLVYVDLIPGTVLRWPAPWTIGIAFACLLIWIAILVRGLAGRLISARQVGWGIVLLPMSIVFALLLGCGVTIALVELTGLNVPWYAELWPTRLAIWAAALAGAVGAGTLLARRAGVYGATIGVWLWWVLLSLLVAWYLPGASVMFLVTTVTGLLVTSIGTFLPGKSEARVLVASLVGVAVASWFWLPFAVVVETMELHQGTGAVAGAMVVLGLSPGLTLLSLVPAKRRVVLTGVGLPALIAVAAMAWAFVTPADSGASPQRLNVSQVEDRANGEAYVALGGDVVGASGGVNVPGEMLVAAEFADRPTVTLPWSTDRLLTAPVAAATESTPLATVIEDRIVDGERRLRLGLGLAPGATRATLYFPAETPVAEIFLAESGQSVMPSAADNGYRSFSCLGRSCAGREIEVALETNGPVPFLVAEFGPLMPEAAQAVIQARPMVAQPSHDGDQYIRIEQIESSPDRP